MKPIKTIRGLASELARREGLKSETSIGNIREILGHLSDMFSDEHDEYPWGEYGRLPVYDILLGNGMRRAKRKNKKK